MPKPSAEQHQEFQDYTNYIEYSLPYSAPLMPSLASIRTSPETASKSTTS